RHIQSRIEQGVLILTIREPDLHGDRLTHRLRQELLAVVEQTRLPKVVLDLQQVVSLSSEAFRPLLSLQRRLTELGGRLVLCNLSPVVAKAFQATRLLGSRRTSSATFEMQPDLPAAIDVLAKTNP